MLQVSPKPLLSPPLLRPTITSQARDKGEIFTQPVTYQARGKLRNLLNHLLAASSELVVLLRKAISLHSHFGRR